MPAIDLLEGVGEKAAAQRISDAVDCRVLTERRVLTHDLGGTAIDDADGGSGRGGAGRESRCSN